MRALIPLAALAALAFAQSAAAATVTLAPVALDPEFQTTLQEELGEREGRYLQREVSEALARELGQAGAQLSSGGEIVIETTIVDAVPNKPTMQQMSDRPGLDFGNSISVGGAELRAVIRGAGGQVLAEVNHEYRSPSLHYVYTNAPWGDAHRAIRGFAEKVSDAYTANAR